MDGECEWPPLLRTRSSYCSSRQAPRGNDNNDSSCGAGRQTSSSQTLCRSCCWLHRSQGQHHNSALLLLAVWTQHPSLSFHLGHTHTPLAWSRGHETVAGKIRNVESSMLDYSQSLEDCSRLRIPWQLFLCFRPLLTNRYGRGWRASFLWTKLKTLEKFGARQQSSDRPCVALVQTV